MTPVSPFRLDLTVWALRRRPHNIVDRWDGITYSRALLLPTGPVTVEVTQSAPSEAARLHVAVVGQPIRAAERAIVTSALERLLGLQIDLSQFYNVAAIHPNLGRLAHRFCGMKPPRFATVFDSAINAIACQQVTLTLGVHLLNRLAMACGAAFGKFAEDDGTAYGFPRPADLARLSPADYRQIGFSHQKGRAMIELAQSTDNGHVDLEKLTTLADDEAVKRLCELKGIGRWSAEYVLLRGLGRTHVFPGDDVGARKNLQRWLLQEKPLDYDAVRRVLSPWARYGGLIYLHLLLDRLAKAGDLDESHSKVRLHDSKIRVPHSRQ